MFARLQASRAFMTFEPMFVWPRLSVFVYVCVSFFVWRIMGVGVYICVCTCPWPLQAEVSERLLSDQVTKVGVFPFSSVACMSASPSLSLTHFASLTLFSLYVSASLSLSGYRGLNLASSRLLLLAPLQTTSSLPVCIPPLRSPFLSFLLLTGWSTLSVGGWKPCDSLH